MGGKSFRTAAITFLLTIVLIALGAVGVIYSGAYNVAASVPHLSVTEGMFELAQRRSVAARVDEVGPPPTIDPEALSHGFIHFDAMCVTCHGAPGIDRSEIGQGINPLPPSLEEEAEEWEMEEIFWITKNGIKLAGMPAFGSTHSDEELWGIAAFVEQLPNMTPADYQQWVTQYRAPPAVEGAPVETHAHPPGTAPHTH